MAWHGMPHVNIVMELRHVAGVGPGVMHIASVLRVVSVEMELGVVQNSLMEYQGLQLKEGYS
jgi:hypothetical protein